MRFFRRSIDFPLICAGLGMLLLFAVSVFFCAGRLPENGPPDLQESSPASSFVLTQADRETQMKNERMIDLSEYAGDCRITEAGDYCLTGTLEGKLCIDAEEQIVHLFFDGVSVASDSGAALSVVSAGKVIVTLCEGTENLLRDSGYYPESGEENACVYSICDLTINGSGSLEVYGFYKDGIHSKDVVKVLDSDISILSKRDGIRGNDGIFLCPGTLNIESEGTGLHTTKVGKKTRGEIELLSGEVSIISGEYAAHSSGDMFMENCSVYGKGIISDVRADGVSYIQEGCLRDD